MPKANRTELIIKMEYYGLVDQQEILFADITIKIDSSNKDAWEVLNIDYVDNNNIGGNLKKVQGADQDLQQVTCRVGARFVTCRLAWHVYKTCPTRQGRSFGRTGATRVLMRRVIRLWLMP